MIDFDWLCLAIKKNCINEIDNFLCQYPHFINFADEEGTIIHKTAKKISIETLEYLMKNYKLDIYALNNQGLSFLHSAARAGRQDLIDYLVSKDYFKITDTTNTGETIFLSAAYGGNQGLISYLHIKYPLIPRTTSLQETAIHFAAINGHNEMIKFLAEDMRIDPQAKTIEGESALHYAARHNQLNTLTFLHENYGLDWYDQANDGTTILSIATHHGLQSVLELIKKYHLDIKRLCDNSSDLIQTAIKRRYAHIGFFFIEEFSFIPQTSQAITATTETQIHFAARDGDNEMIRFLADIIKIDPKAKTITGESALHYAAYCNRVPTLSFLHENYGLDWYDKTIDGITIFHIAAFLGYKPVLELIKKYKLDIKKLCYNSSDLIQIAFKGQRNDIAQFLMTELYAKPQISEPGLDSEPISHQLPSSIDAIVDSLSRQLSSISLEETSLSLTTSPSYLPSRNSSSKGDPGQFYKSPDRCIK